MNTSLEDYQSIKGKDPVFWFTDLYAVCSFMWSVSFICNLSLLGHLANDQVKLRLQIEETQLIII